VLAPRSWIGLLFWLQRFTPQTWSCPLIASGVEPVGVVVVGVGVGVRVAVGVGVGVGVRVAVGVGVGVLVTVPEHVTPLTVKLVGTGLDPLQEPLKPKLVWAPLASDPL
jgi:hypothetical protein